MAKLLLFSGVLCAAIAAVMCAAAAVEEGKAVEKRDYFSHLEDFDPEAALEVASSTTHISYQKTGDCEEENEHLYKYVAKEQYFEKEMEQSFELTVLLKVTCTSVGTYNGQKAKRYKMVITDTKVGGSAIDRVEEGSKAEGGSRAPPELKGLETFFVQTADGSIPVIQYPRVEDKNEIIINIKKAIVSAFQTNFERTEIKEEADPQSLHKSHYTYQASLQDLEEGAFRAHRSITVEDVEGFANHLPTEEVELKKEEDIVYKRGVLTHASGVMEVKLMPKENSGPEDDMESDNLESQQRSRRDASEESNEPDDIRSYDPNLKTNHYSSKGSYTIELVGQRRLSRNRRHTEREPTDMVASTLLGFINQTRRDMEKMADLRYEIGDMNEALETLHMDPNNSAVAHEIEHLVKLEAKYGPLPGHSPAIDDVLEYLKELSGLDGSKDIEMRIILYYIISPEGSIGAQMALLDSLETAENDEEKEAVILYIALAANPHPQFVARLEGLISSDVHSTDPILLAYGAIVPRASPELQQRMVLFLTSRLPEAETNSTSLVHHILSLGNSGSPQTSTHLIDYLSHPETDIQLIAIFAMRFMMSVPAIEQSLTDFLLKPNITEDHLHAMIKSLLYGSERAAMQHQVKPYSSDLANALVVLSVNVQNKELHSLLQGYLKDIGNEHSLQLLEFMKLATSGNTDERHSNETRLRRGTRWDEPSDVYNLVSPLGTRQNDVQRYQNRLSYIWGKKFGVSDINAQFAAGGFAGVSTSGDYKLFGRAVAKAKCYDRSLTIVDFLVFRTKDSTSTHSRLYAVVMGINLINVNLRQGSSVCETISRPLYQTRKYTVFDFTYSVFVVVGTLNFRLRATLQFSAGTYVRFCDNRGSGTAAVGLSPTLTIVVSASGDLEIVWVAKAGLTLVATFNYQMLPEVSAELCYKQSQIRNKNCLTVYHQWTDNKLDLYAWYAWRGWCGWWACTGSDAYKDKKKISGLSKSWALPETGKMKIWGWCDQNYQC